MASNQGTTGTREGSRSSDAEQRVGTRKRAKQVSSPKKAFNSLEAEQRVEALKRFVRVTPRSRKSANAKKSLQVDEEEARKISNLGYFEPKLEYRKSRSRNSKNIVLIDVSKLSKRNTESDKALLNDVKKPGGATPEQLLKPLITEFGFSQIANVLVENASLDDCARIKGMVSHRLSILGQGHASLHVVDDQSNRKTRRRATQLSDEQVAAIKVRAMERPWIERPVSLEGMSPFEWVRITYSEWLKRGLKQSDLRVDESLYGSLRQWRSQHGAPSDIDLPARPLKKAKKKKPPTPK